MKKFAIALFASLLVFAASPAWTTQATTWGEGAGRFVAAFPGTPEVGPFGDLSTSYDLSLETMRIAILVTLPPRAITPEEQEQVLDATPATFASEAGIAEPRMRRIDAHGLRGWALEGRMVDGTRVLARGFVGDRAVYTLRVNIAPGADGSADQVATAFLDSFRPAP